MKMRMSDAGIALITSSEDCELKAYPDPGTKNDPIKKGKPWTIGYGHTKGVCEGLTCTKEQAIQWLKEDVKEAEDAVNRSVLVPISQSQFDALADFVFNVGTGAFTDSTLLRVLNAGRYDEVDAQLKRWNRANGKVLAGLVIRRDKEADMFEDHAPGQNGAA